MTGEPLQRKRGAPFLPFLQEIRRYMARLCDFIASDNAVSEGYCRRRLPKIIETLAVMMFGPKAM